MQINAAFHDHQSQPGTVAPADIPPALESVEQPRLILVGNADATVTNGKYGVRSLARDDEVDRLARSLLEGDLDRAAADDHFAELVRDALECFVKPVDRLNVVVEHDSWQLLVGS